MSTRHSFGSAKTMPSRSPWSVLTSLSPALPNSSPAASTPDTGDAPTGPGVYIDSTFVGALVLASFMIPIVDGLDRVF